MLASGCGVAFEPMVMVVPVASGLVRGGTLGVAVAEGMPVVVPVVVPMVVVVIVSVVGSALSTRVALVTLLVPV